MRPGSRGSDGGGLLGSQHTLRSSLAGSTLRPGSRGSDGYATQHTLEGSDVLSVAQHATQQTLRSALEESDAFSGTQHTLRPGQAGSSATEGTGGFTGTQYTTTSALEGTQYTQYTTTEGTLFETALDGTWHEGDEVHTIQGAQLHWANGIVTDIEITSPESFVVILFDEPYDAHLEEGGNVLRWCDGDVWLRPGGDPELYSTLTESLGGRSGLQKSRGLSGDPDMRSSVAESLGSSLHKSRGLASQLGDPDMRSSLAESLASRSSLHKSHGLASQMGDPDMRSSLAESLGSRSSLHKSHGLASRMGDAEMHNSLTESVGDRSSLQKSHGLSGTSSNQPAALPGSGPDEGDDLGDEGDDFGDEGDEPKVDEEQGAFPKGHKVEVLLGSLHLLKRNLPMVLPLLPQNLRQLLMDPELAKECKHNFEELDRSRRGRLAPEDLLPVVGSMSLARRQSVNFEQCRRFAGIFDSNEDGLIEQSEFTGLMRFSLILAFLESEEGKQAAAMVESEEHLFQDFLRTLDQDWRMLDEVVPLLPAWLRSHLGSAEFEADWMAHFDNLDQDRNGVLDPLELLPEVLRLSEAHPLSIGLDKCKQFANIFDRRKDGVIRRDEFLDLAKFLTVMCYLAGDEEPVEVGEHSADRMQRQTALPPEQLKQLLGMLEEDRNRLSEVIPFLPAWLKADIMREDFVEACREGFRGLDENENGFLDPVELFPVVIRLCQAHPFSLGHQACLRFTAIFDSDRNGVIGADEFVDFARFLVVMGFLTAPRGPQGSFAIPEELPERSPPRLSGSSLERTRQLLQALQADEVKLGEVVIFLPAAIREPLLSAAFAEECLAGFDRLDSSARGALGSGELVPAIVGLGAAQPFTVTEAQCRQFTGLLSEDESVVIRRSEYVSYAHFMLALAYFETEEGQAAAEEVQLTLGRRRAEDLLDMLERDRRVVHKAVPLLPRELAEHLAGGEFAARSAERFAELGGRRGGEGHLFPADLVPLVAELSLAHPAAVDEEVCKRFISIFDVRVDGVLHEDEFLEFARFLCIMSWLHSKEGAALVREGLNLMEGSQRADELLATLRTDRRSLPDVAPYLPGWLRSELFSEQLTASCVKHFKEVDRRQKGVLEPRLLFPAVVSFTVSRRLHLDLEKYERSTALFDDEGTGVVSQADFPDLVRYVLTMAYLQSQDGQKRLEIPVTEQCGALSSRPSTAPSPVASSLGIGLTDSAVAGAGRDIQLYRSRAERLELENEAQHEHILALEAALRRRNSLDREGLFERDLGQTDMNLGAAQVLVG